MRLTRLLVPIAIAAVATVLTPAAANAQDYPPTGPTVTVSDSTVVVGDTVEVEGTGFAPGETISITVEYGPIAMGVPRGARSFVPPTRKDDASSVRADKDGDFRTKVTLTQVGRAVITATGETSKRSGSASVLVLSSRSELPTTGTDGGSYLRVAVAGAAALVAGLALVAVARRRRRTESPS